MKQIQVAENVTAQFHDADADAARCGDTSDRMVDPSGCVKLDNLALWWGDAYGLGTGVGNRWRTARLCGSGEAITALGPAESHARLRSEWEQQEAP